MEFDFGEVALSHLEHIVGVGEEHVASLAVSGHELMLALLERGQCLGVVTLDPASLLERDWFPATLRAILVKQAVLYHLKLKLTNGAYELAAVKLVGEELCHTFVHELLYTLLELL